MTSKHTLSGLLLFLSLAVPFKAQAACSATKTPIRTAERLALVIGNKDYATVPLHNPLNDACDMKNALENVGFQVIYRENADLPGMDAAVREFVHNLNKSSVGVVYYSGHGAQADGSNYLIPVGADISSKAELKARSYDVGIILGEMQEAGNRVNIIILDACRNNPFKGFKGGADGLAMMSGPKGSLIAYATAPGSVANDGRGHNSPYTASLKQYLVQPGLKVQDMFMKVREAVLEQNPDQVPWENSSIIGDFCFAGCAASLPPVPQVASPAPTVDYRVEISFWDSIKNSDNPADFRAYLQQYPGGQFASLANNWLARLQTPVAAPSAAPAPATPPAPSTPPASEGWQTLDRYQVKGGLVKDTQTGLMWQRCSRGQTWDGAHCAGSAEQYTRQAAMDLRDDSAGYSDWRLPTLEELRTLVYCSSGRPALWNSTGDFCEGDYQHPTIFQAAFPSTPDGWFWSSSPVAGNSVNAWIVHFGFGSVSYDGKYGNDAVRLVRAGQ